MLTAADNDLLTRVGPGTPMGRLLREFWFPVLPSMELEEPGCRPLRMRLLGEDLVIFRNTSGEVGLLSEYCSHRGASLYFGRNEDEGLRCVYHGWLYSPDGRCLEMPAEPASSNFKDKIKHPSYPCREVNGTIWAYMGPREDPPPFPDYGLARMPVDHKAVRLTVRECNWMQALEGDLDLSHGAYLHSTVNEQYLGSNHLDRFLRETPHFEAVDTEYGVAHAIRRGWDEDNYLWGIGHYFFPFLTQFPPVGDAMQVVPGHIWVPMDDRTTLVWSTQWHPTRPIAYESSQGTLGGGQSSQVSIFDWGWEKYIEPDPEPGGRWHQKGNRKNDYGFSEEAQLTRRYSGLPAVELQDRGIQESMGPIVDRTIEHLGVNDVPQIRVRQRLLKAVMALEEQGIVPSCVDKPSAYRFRSATGLLPKAESWVEGTHPWCADEPGVPVVAKGHRPPDYEARIVTGRAGG